MIDSILNLLFRCSHKRITLPITPVSKTGVPQGGMYVVCLDCGKQFAYDWQEMRIGKPVPISATSGVLQPEKAKSQKKKFGYAALASALPAAWIIRRALKGPKKAPKTQKRS